MSYENHKYNTSKMFRILISKKNVPLNNYHLKVNQDLCWILVLATYDKRSMWKDSDEPECWWYQLEKVVPLFSAAYTFHIEAQSQMSSSADQSACGCSKQSGRLGFWHDHHSADPTCTHTHFELYWVKDTSYKSCHPRKLSKVMLRQDVALFTAISVYSVAVPSVAVTKPKTLPVTQVG